MEPTPFDLTPAQKGLLQSLSRKTGKPIDALLDEALEGLQRDARPDEADTAPNGSHVEDVQDAADHADTAAPPPIWEQFAATDDIPDEEWDKLPTDLASQHDHYIYGTPKRPL